MWSLVPYEFENIYVYILCFSLDVSICGAQIKQKKGLCKKNKSHHLTEKNTLTHSQRPALAVGSSGRLVKILTDLHLCCLGFWEQAYAPLWSCRQLQRGGLWGQGTTEGGAERELGCGKEREREEWMSMGVRKEGREVTRAVQGTPNQHCVNRPPSGVDRLLGESSTGHWDCQQSR